MKAINIKLKLSILFFFCIVIIRQSIAQEEQMSSQYLFNMMNINPAYAGNRGVANLTSLFRNQWSGVEGAPRYGNISFDMPFQAQNSAIGLQFISDKIGVQKNQGVKFNYAYRIQFADEQILSLGLNVGIKNRRANYTEVSTFISGDPLLNSNISSLNADAGFGVFYSSQKFFIGASSPMLLVSNVNSNDPLETNAKWLQAVKANDLNMFLTTGYLLNLSQQIKLMPSVMLRRGSSSMNADLNAKLWINDILSIGASYRTQESILGMIEWQMSPFLRFGYSYDRSTSKTKLYNIASNELMLRISFSNNSNLTGVSKYF
jgi:type IX secretion system PorP/SprF family membrane protein